MMTRLCLSIAITITIGLAAAVQAQIRPLTEDQLRAAAAQDAATPINDPFYTRMNNGGPEVETALAAAERGPFAISIETPYSRVYTAAAEARRKFTEMPVLRLDEVNGLGVIVTIGPGRNFLSAGTVEGLVLKRGDVITRPVESRFAATTIRNAIGGSRESTIGRFQFPLDAFAPEAGPVTLVCIGKEGNFEWTISTSDLHAMR